ncbi:hypothetical protein IRJ41_009600 [Triplophysa rosa]|uniref:Uncharacterized protein n=1 Tax=Triplophysa rosa TaxID=992332 RepID=A0A9W7X5P5_TRIRA|nr:hypothetical protein IRJ41_009600 [Triplophysa rosa]
MKGKTSERDRQREEEEEEGKELDMRDEATSQFDPPFISRFSFFTMAEIWLANMTSLSLRIVRLTCVMKCLSAYT